MFSLKSLIALMLLLVGVFLLFHFVAYAKLHAQQSQLRAEYRAQLLDISEQLEQTIESAETQVLRMADTFLEDHFRLRPMSEVALTITGSEGGIELALFDLLDPRHQVPNSDFPFIFQSHLQTAMEEQRPSMEVISEESEKEWLMAVPISFRNTVESEEHWVAVAWLPVERLEAALRVEPDSIRNQQSTTEAVLEGATNQEATIIDVGESATVTTASTDKLLELMQEISGSPRILIGSHGLGEHNPLFVAEMRIEGWILKISPSKNDVLVLQRGANFIWLGLAILTLVFVALLYFRPHLFGLRAQTALQKNSVQTEQNLGAVETESSLESTGTPLKFDDKSALASEELDEEVSDLEASMSTEELEDRDSSEREQGVEIPSKLFRAYDIRGDSELLLRPGFPELVGKSLGTLALREGESALHLCRDGRLSSEELHNRFCQGVLSSGCDVIDLGVGPTPLLSFAVATNNQCGSGAMITASHNPAHHNGFKLILNHEILFGEELQRLKNSMNNGKFSAGSGELYSIDFVSEYLRYIREDILVEGEPHIVIDGSNGAAGQLAIQALEQIGCRVTPLFCEIDGNFPNHSPDNINSKNLAQLIETVSSIGADIGFAFDGDGDRIIAVTSSGRIVWPDQLMVLFSEDILLSRPASTIVFDVKCTRLLASRVGSLGGRPLMTRSGRSFVALAQRQNEAPFAGEFSGHLFFADRWFGTDDGIYAAARLVELVTRSSTTLDAMINRLPLTYTTEEIAIPIEEERKDALLYEFRRQIEQTSGRILSIDGIRVEFPAGWGLLRASNTGANLSLRFEAQNPEALEELQALFRTTLLKAEPGIQLTF